MTAAAPPDARRFDVVLFGATGFTGRLTAEYLARRAAAEGLRWAVAGRDADKLEGLVSALADLAEAPPAILQAQVGDPQSLRRMASETRVVATTVGPYARWGEEVVAACVDGGASYADITGEPEFVARVVERYHPRARDLGLRLVSCCGFDSIPHDLGALLTVLQLPDDVPTRVEGFVHGVGSFSGGTWHSAVEAMGRAGDTLGALRSHLDPGPGRRVGGTRPRPRYERRLGSWVAPLPTIDPWIVLRSACDLEAFGPSFRYGHYVRVGSLPALAAGAAFVGSVATLARFAPTRRLLLSAKRSGDGPNESQRARSRFDVVFFGEAGDATAVVEVSGGDPGYGETSKMLAESALCLALDGDRLPERYGALTPASAMGEVLIERLRAAGMGFEVVDAPGRG
ncbi:MAG: saccharopine dehydrogenase NADP-binding domain-containing protein [Acidobacteriota bacterium]